MAMVPCPDCGKSVSDNAPSCPNCGRQSPGGQAQLEVRRVSRMQAALVPMALWIDGTHYGYLKSGKKVTLTVTPGIHRVEVDMQQPMTKGGAEEFDVPAGRKLVVVVTPSRMSGKPSFSAELA